MRRSQSKTEQVIDLLDKEQLIPDWWGKDRVEELEAKLREILNETE